MDVTVAVVRVFGTKDQYGDAPRIRPPGLPLNFPDFPASGASVRVDLGPVPEELLTAERTRRALGRTMLMGIASAGPNDASQRFELARQETSMADLTDEFNWYTTIVLERTLDLKQRADTVGEFVFPENFWELEHEPVDYAIPTLDIVTSMLSTVLDPGNFDVLVLDDRVHLFAEGKEPSGIPIFGGSANASLIRGGEAPIREVSNRIRLLREIKTPDISKQEWLGRVAHWRVQSLRERDPWKRFLWSFLALEILVHKLENVLRTDFISRLRVLESEHSMVTDVLPFEEIVWSKERSPLRSRFALVASALFPASANDDFTEFAKVNQARGDLAHGAIRNAGELPTESVQALLDKYFTAAFKKLLLRIEPTESWEAAAARLSARHE